MTRIVPASPLLSPLDVADRFMRGWSDASLVRHTLVTLSEVLGVLLAAVVGFAVAKSAVQSAGWHQGLPFDAFLALASKLEVRKSAPNTRGSSSTTWLIWRGA